MSPFASWLVIICIGIASFWLAKIITNLLYSNRTHYKRKSNPKE